MKKRARFNLFIRLLLSVGWKAGIKMAKIFPEIYLQPKLWRTLFERRTTARYPFVSLELPDGFRGRVEMWAQRSVWAAGFVCGIVRLLR